MKKEAGGISKKAFLMVSILLLGAVLAAMPQGRPACADDTSLGASVTVIPASQESYGERVVASSRILMRWRALGEPDGRGAWMLHQGWASIRLADTVTDCNTVSIWAAKIGFWSPKFKVYVSANGRRWTYIGSGKCTSQGYAQHDFTGTFGDVKYIQVRRIGSSRWSFMLLDAVRAGGGDA